tara:strand:+ start:202 stop:540 length:339 start_codon:yes stop_codon:yes gene_type:complete
MIKKSFGASLTGTSQDIYEVPAGKRAQWVLMYVSNTSGSNGTTTVNFYDSSATATLPVLSGYTVTAKQYFQIGGDYNSFITMEEGDKISASATQSMTLLLSVIEENVIIQGG